MSSSIYASTHKIHLVHFIPTEIVLHRSSSWLLAYPCRPSQVPRSALYLCVRPPPQRISKQKVRFIWNNVRALCMQVWLTVAHRAAMTDYKEEQEGELEALRSIYPDEELKGSGLVRAFNLAL